MPRFWDFQNPNFLRSSVWNLSTTDETTCTQSLLCKVSSLVVLAANETWNKIQ